jgi:hypothetical protein
MPIITGAEINAYFGLGDSVDDAQLDAAAAAACQAVNEHCGRTFDTTDLGDVSARVYRPNNQCAVSVDDFWSTSGLVVKTDDNDDGTFETTWTIDTDFLLQPDNGLQHGQAWPYNRLIALNTKWFPTWNRRPAVQVTAAWGWATPPAAVKSATLIQGARIFKRRTSPEGVLGGFADFGVARITPRDHDVVALLGPFMHPSKAALVG